jgi:hypothetical protein
VEVVCGIPSKSSPSDLGRRSYETRALHNPRKGAGGVKMMPHEHPEARIYTVMSGVFYIAPGEQFDKSKLAAYAPGSIVVLPGNQPHFHWAKSGKYMVQVTEIGALGMDFIDPDNDPRIPKLR